MFGTITNTDSYNSSLFLVEEIMIVIKSIIIGSMSDRLYLGCTSSYDKYVGHITLHVISDISYNHRNVNKTLYC